MHHCQLAPSLQGFRRGATVPLGREHLAAHLHVHPSRPTRPATGPAILMRARDKCSFSHGVDAWWMVGGFSSMLVFRSLEMQRAEQCSISGLRCEGLNTLQWV